MFDNDTNRNIFIPNLFKDSEDEIDLDGSDIIYLINVTEVLSQSSRRGRFRKTYKKKN